MALLFCDGFDMGILPDWQTSAAVTASTTTAFGTGFSAAPSVLNSTMSIAVPATSEMFVGFRYTTTASNSNTVMSLLGDGGLTEHIRLWWSSSTTLNAGRAAASVATASVPEPINSWAYIEVRATVADSGGRLVVKVDGTTVIDFTGDTKNGGTASTLDAVRLAAGPSGGARKFDDLYVNDATGAAPWNTFYGPCRIYPLVPTGAGTDTQFTPSAAPNWDCVNEQPYSATDYVTGTAVGLRDTYTMADLPTNVTTVFGLRLTAVAKAADAAAVGLKTATRSGGTVYTGTATALGASDSTVSAIRSVNPATGAAWTVAEVNAAEAGFEVA